jgi:uncharacterized protein involved in outer membrane biogenesis
MIQLLLRQALLNLAAGGVKEAIMDRKKVVRYVLIAVGVLIVILLALPLFINANSFCPTIEEKLSAALGRKVQVGDLSLSIFSGSLTASNLSIADDPAFSTSPFLTAKTFYPGVEVWPLITSKTLNVTSLTIENPGTQPGSEPARQVELFHAWRHQRATEDRGRWSGPDS